MRESGLASWLLWDLRCGCSFIFGLCVERGLPKNYGVPVESRQHARPEAHRDFHAVVVNHVDETAGGERLRREENVGEEGEKKSEWTKEKK